MRRAFAVAALLAAALATWLELRGDAPTNEATPAATPKSEHAAPTSRPRASTGSATAARRASAVDADATAPISVGRLVDGQGAPIARYDVIARVVDVDTDWDSLASSTTDAEGRFRFVLRRPKDDAAAPKLEIGRSVSDAGLERAKIYVASMRRIALVDLPSTLPAGEVAVGDVVWLGTALLASGVAVDAEGRPLRGVEVRAMDESFGIRSPTDDDAAVTDDSGRFELRGVPPKSRVVLGATLDGYCVAERATSAVGATDADDGAPVEVVVGADPAEISRQTKRSR